MQDTGKAIIVLCLIVAIVAFALAEIIEKDKNDN